jgi:hypothetical protein
LAKLDRIYQLSYSLSKAFDINLASELINLVYSTNPYGQARVVSLAEKLAIFNCGSYSINQFKVDEVGENNDLPNKLFIVGFFLGDGSLGFVFAGSPLRGSRALKFYIKVLFNFASHVEYNFHLLTLIAKAMNLEPIISIKNGSMLTL